LNQYKILMDPRKVWEKFSYGCWVRARCPSPLEVKVNLDTLHASKHVGLRHDNPSARGCWGAFSAPLVLGVRPLGCTRRKPSALHRRTLMHLQTCTGRTPSALHSAHALGAHTRSKGSGYLPEPMFLGCFI